MDRPDLYVVARFLERLAEAGAPLGKTELQLRVRVNYTIFQRYLAWLTQRGYAEEKDDKITLTKKGRDAYGTLVRWIRDATLTPTNPPPRDPPTK